MNAILKGFSFVVYGVEKAVAHICSLLFSIMIVSVFSEIVLRSLFRASLIWSSELATYCFMWLTFLGSAIGVLRMTHLTADLLYKWVPEGHIVGKILEWFQLVLIAILGWVFVKYGIVFVEKGMSRMSYALGIPTGYNMMLIVVTGVLYMLNAVYLLIVKLIGWENGHD